jgi:hypothetical protein
MTSSWIGRNRESASAVLPKISTRRLFGVGDLWVLEAKLDYGDGDPYKGVLVFEMRDGLIARETAYWSKPFAAPEWRATWVERITNDP